MAKSKVQEDKDVKSATVDIVTVDVSASDVIIHEHLGNDQQDQPPAFTLGLTSSAKYVNDDVLHNENDDEGTTTMISMDYSVANSITNIGHDAMSASNISLGTTPSHNIVSIYNSHASPKTKTETRVNSISVRRTNRSVSSADNSEEGADYDDDRETKKETSGLKPNAEVIVGNITSAMIETSGPYIVFSNDHGVTRAGNVENGDTIHGFDLHKSTTVTVDIATSFDVGDEMNTYYDDGISSKEIIVDNGIVDHENATSRPMSNVDHELISQNSSLSPSAVIINEDYSHENTDNTLYTDSSVKRPLNLVKATRSTSVGHGDQSDKLAYDVDTVTTSGVKDETSMDKLSINVHAQDEDPNAHSNHHYHLDLVDVDLDKLGLAVGNCNGSARHKRKVGPDLAQAQPAPIEIPPHYANVQVWKPNMGAPWTVRSEFREPHILHPELAPQGKILGTSKLPRSNKYAMSMHTKGTDLDNLARKYPMKKDAMSMFINGTDLDKMARMYPMKRKRYRMV